MSQPDQPLLPPAMLGILGGGQLGRFFVIAAHEMGYKVTVLDPDPKSPAFAAPASPIAKVATGIPLGI